LRASFRQNPTKEDFAELKRKRFSVEQIVAIVKQAEMGMPVAELLNLTDYILWLT
jgi:hypothetical protein